MKFLKLGLMLVVLFSFSFNFSTVTAAKVNLEEYYGLEVLNKSVEKIVSKDGSVTISTKRELKGGIEELYNLISNESETNNTVLAYVDDSLFQSKSYQSNNVKELQVSPLSSTTSCFSVPGNYLSQCVNYDLSISSNSGPITTTWSVSGFVNAYQSKLPTHSSTTINYTKPGLKTWAWGLTGSDSIVVDERVVWGTSEVNSSTLSTTVNGTGIILAVGYSAGGDFSFSYSGHTYSGEKWLSN